MHRTTISCNNLIMSSSRRPPGDGKEEVLYQELECSLQQHEKMTRYEEKPTLPSDRCDGKDSSSPSSASATPPFMKWSVGLHHLLNDEEGIHLFIQYLEQENLGTLGLEFWLACVGMRKKWQDEQNNDGRNFIRLLNNAFVSRLNEISSKTKRDIAEKIKSNEHLNCHIFDVAQREVEEKVLTSAYMNFLQSDIYVQYVQQVRAESMRKDGVEEGSQDIDTCLNQDNEDSKEGSPKKGYFGSVRSNSQETLDVLPTLVEDRELELSHTVNKTEPTVQHLYQRKFANLVSRIKPESEAWHYLKAKTPGYNTSYHARYASVLPPSAQDSELQSLSSDAQTDDNISLADSSLVEYSLAPRNKCSSRTSDKHHRSNKSCPIMNKDPIPFDFVPKVKSTNVSKAQGLDSEEFQKLLNEKLLKLQMTQLQEEMKAQSILDAHVSRVWAPSTQQTPTRTPGSLTPPPTIQPYNTLGSRQRPASSSAMANQIVPYSYSYSQYNKAVVNQPYLQHNDSIRHRRERDAVSCDSGTVHDYSSDIEPSVTGRQSWPGFVPDPQHGDFASSAEYKRRLKEQAKRSSSGKKLSAWESRSSFDSGVSLNHVPVCNDQQKKPTRKSYPSMMPASPQPCPEITPVLYSYGRGTNTVPYLSKLPGKNITLKQFKSLLKKGSFRYFFKKDIPDFGIVYEEITEENEVLPLWEGKIHSVIEVID